MYDLKIEKIIAKSAPEVFKSLQEGKLFMNCGSDSNSISIDFRVGGKYKINFWNNKKSNWGEFLEIIPNQKIVFSWCQTFDEDQKPDTKVTIELFAEGPKTKLVLEHRGFKDQPLCDAHTQGWTTGITDLANEMEDGRIRLVRRYDVPMEKLYEKFKEAKVLTGDCKYFDHDHRITMDANVALNFTMRDENSSAVEILHGNLSTDKEKDNSRNNWDLITAKVSEIIG